MSVCRSFKTRNYNPDCFIRLVRHRYALSLLLLKFKLIINKKNKGKKERKKRKKKGSVSLTLSRVGPTYSPAPLTNINNREQRLLFNIIRRLRFLRNFKSEPFLLPRLKTFSLGNSLINNQKHTHTQCVCSVSRSLSFSLSKRKEGKIHEIRIKFDNKP